jgi:SAM-dependent methyltransferase
MAMTSINNEFNCAVCGIPTPHRQVYKKWSYPVMACKHCGLGSIPAGSDFDPISLYNRGYFSGERVDGYVDYLGSEPVLRQEFRRVLRALCKYGPPGGKLLEVGCAYGFFLSEASGRYQCVGVELAPSAVTFARSRGLKVYQGNLSEQIIAEQGPFDAAVMLDCIEHLVDPAGTVKLIAQSLRREGCLMLTTGDWDSPLARIMKDKWRLMTPPQHLFFFSPRTLTALLRRFGLKVLSISHPWKIVPIGLAIYQVRSRFGPISPGPAWLSRLGLPVNLFDTVRVIARKI